MPSFSFFHSTFALRSQEHPHCHYTHLYFPCLSHLAKNTSRFFPLSVLLDTPAYTDGLPTTSSLTSSRPRPSLASHLQDPDEPLIVSTTFPKKARPLVPPPSLRTSATSNDCGSCSTLSTPRTSSTTTPPDLFGFLLKPTGEGVRFRIPRPSLAFKLPEATRYSYSHVVSLLASLRQKSSSLSF